MSLQEFNVIVAGTLASHRGEFSLLNSQCIVARHADDPAIQGLRMMVRVEGLTSVQFAGCSFNGVALPDGFVLRMQV